jgi:phosphate starvation-inducible PhoH-like protein
MMIVIKLETTMPTPKNRAVNRQKRREGKPCNHDPFLQLVESDVRRKSTKPRNATLKPLTEAQERYDAQIRSKLITFGVGPAGTGKTWWAAMRAAEAFRDGEIASIIITRPAIEAGEKMGFLPGELEDKYEPYFRPVRDALEECLGSGHLEYALKSKQIEARPLGYLRGATLKNCWVIADEMQNATKSEIKLLLTRFGENSKFVVNGDPDQCDLPDQSRSGLMDAIRRLETHEQIGVTKFSIEDIVRHGIVQDIIRAYAD